MNQKIEASFSVLVMSIASSALMALGLAPHPQGEKTPIDREMARFNIDLLIVLQEKTKNNLTQEETQLIGSLITDLQMKFVQNK